VSITISEAIERYGLRSDETAKALVGYVSAIVRKRCREDDEGQKEMIARGVARAFMVLAERGDQGETRPEVAVREAVRVVLRNHARERQRSEMFRSLADVNEGDVSEDTGFLLLQVREDLLDRIGVKGKCRARNMALDVLRGKTEISSYCQEDQRIIRTFVWRMLYVNFDSPAR